MELHLENAIFTVLFFLTRQLNLRFQRVWRENWSGFRRWWTTVSTSTIVSNGKYLFEENIDINIMQLLHVAAKIFQDVVDTVI